MTEQLIGKMLDIRSPKYGVNVRFVFSLLKGVSDEIARPLWLGKNCSG